jgi:hypothetical protein
MTEELRWGHTSERFPLPDDVRAAMRAVLAEALREAARKDDPGDGSMIMLSPEKIIGKGMWDGGWKLQASLVEDERMNPKPFVVVHAYQDSTLTKGSVSADVVRTPEDRRYLGQKRLASMVQRRDALNVSIEKLSSELGATNPDTSGDEPNWRDDCC